MSNLTTQEQRPKFSVALSTKGYQDLIQNTIKDPKRVATFIASITSAVATNPALSACDTASILSAALLGEGLRLSPSPQLGQFYMIPFKQKAKGGVDLPAKAQFVLGYKGYIQLAIRSGYYKNIDVVSLKEGELKSWDRLTGEVAVSFMDDIDAREKAKTTHYYAFIEYLNGFKKTMVMTHAQMMEYADKYSNAFSASAYRKLINNEIEQKDLWKYSSFWYKEFDSMAEKTMLRQIISKWGMMSVELQTAFEADEKIAVAEQGQITTIDAEQPTEDFELEPQAIDMNSL